MPKLAIYQSEAFDKLTNGIDKLAKAVVSTLGPNGKNVIIQGFGGEPIVTKDGVTVARFFDLADPVEKLGADIVKQAAFKVNKIGDGTTTTTLLAQNIIGSIKNMTGDVHTIRKNIQHHADAVCTYLDSIAVPVDTLDMLTKVATISANNDAELGALVAGVVWEVGKDGVVTVDEWAGTDIQTEKVDGCQIPSGYIAREMVTNVDKMECQLSDVAVLVTDKKLSSVSDIMPLMEKMVTGFGGKTSPAKQLVIIADDVEGDALGTLVVNKIRAGFVTLAVRAPGFANRRESLRDLAVMLGATVVSDENAIRLDNIKPTDLGRVKRVTASKDATTFIGGAGSDTDVAAAVAEINAELENSKLSDYQREKLMERKARLTGGVAIIRVGAYSESEMKERKFLVDDAVGACKAAMDGGIVAGGGVALLRASGATVGPLTATLEAPAKALAHGTVITTNAESNAGYDAKNEEFVQDMVASGIIDPVKVVKATLQNAVSVASMLLTTDCVLYDEPEVKK